MKTEVSVTTSLTALAPAILSGSSCGPQRADLVRQGIVKIQTAPSKRVEIYWVSAYRHKEHMDIAGHPQTGCLKTTPKSGVRLLAVGELDTCRVAGYFGNLGGQVVRHQSRG